MINISAFQTRTPYVHPLDNLNIEMIYPGKSDGSVSERIAYNVLEVVKKADYAIDCHGGDLDEMMYDNTWCPFIGDKKIDKLSKEIAMSYGFEYICLQRSSPNTYSRTIASAKMGVPAIQSECGSVGSLNISDFDRNYKGITNVMKYLHMIEGTPEINVKQKIVESVIRMRVDEGGVFFPKVNIGNKVKRGEIIGEIWNLHGELQSEIISPDNGVIRKIFTHQAAYTGRKVLELFASLKPV
jgi:predicted deacylase